MGSNNTKQEKGDPMPLYLLAIASLFFLSLFIYIAIHDEIDN